jgi:hypothetical protein
MRAIKVGLVLALVLVFGLTAATSMAADNKDVKKNVKKEMKKDVKKAGQWCVIKYQTKDKKTVCKVVECKGKTPKTIAGPFKSKDEALKAKEKSCPPAKKK